jgi:hypothetical protein
LKRIGVNTIPGIEEVNIFKDDVIIQFQNPKGDVLPCYRINLYKLLTLSNSVDLSVSYLTPASDTCILLSVYSVYIQPS